MTNLASALMPAIDELEKDYADLERQANALLTSINVLRAKAGMPPRTGGPAPNGGAHGGGNSPTGSMKIVSDAFTGKTLGAAVRQYLEMRERAGIDRPATTREIFDSLKEGGFSSNAKDDETAMVVLRTMLRKNTTMFAKLKNGKYGLRSWYPTLKAAKPEGKGSDDGAEQDNVIELPDGTEKKASAA